MFSKLMALLFGSLALSIPFPDSGQATAPKPSAGQPTAPGLRELTGDDEKRAKQLDEQIDKALDADRWDEAVARAEELFTLRTHAQGPKHFETVDAEWRQKTLRRVARLPRDDRVAYKSAISIHKQGMSDNGQGKYAHAQPLFEQALEIFRRLLSDDNPETAACYNDLAVNLNGQGKYALAQPLFEKALEIRRRVLTDDHPETAATYDDVATNLSAQGRYSQAQPLHEKALEIMRRLLSDDHPNTARCYNNVANNLHAQGKYAQRSPCLRRRWLSSAGCLRTTIRIPRSATTTWRPTFGIRVSMPRRSPCSRKRWRSSAACSLTNTPTPPSATTTWR